MRRSIHSILGWVEKLGQSWFRGKIKPLVANAGEANKVVSKICIPEADRELISENLPIVLGKYGVSSAYMPEIGLATGLIGAGCGFLSAMAELNDLLAEKKRHDEKAAALQKEKTHAAAN